MTLLDPGTTYDLLTNASIDGIDGTAAPGAQLEVHTDQTEGMPDTVGDGHVGPITLAADSTLTVHSRGDFGGATAGAGSTADELTFANLTGPISGFSHVNQIDASGDVSGVSVSDGIDSISAASVDDVSSETDSAGPASPLTIKVDAGGVGGSLAFGNQPTTIYQLNDQAQVTSVTDPDGNATTFTYDTNGNPATMTTPQGTWTFSYSTNGDLLTETSPAGWTRTLTYDASNNVVSDVTTDSAGNVLFQDTITRDSSGNPLTVTDASGATTTTTYTSTNQVATQTDPSGVTQTYSYDTAGNPTVVQDTLGGAVDTTYNSQEQATEQDFTSSASAPLRVDATYTSTGQVATLTYYADLAGTTVLGSVQYSYDTAGHVTELKALDGSGAVLEDYVYSYNTAGQLLSETRNGVVDATYSYDAAGEVISDGTHTYSYDAAGNRTMPGYVTGPGNELLSDGTWNYSYDAAGNMTGKTYIATGETWTYGYGLDGRITHAEDRDASGQLAGAGGRDVQPGRPAE